MAKTVVASIQQQMRLYETPEAYRREVMRFLTVVRMKGAHMVIFPALTAVMAISPLMQGLRVRLLKQADSGRAQGPFWQRARAALAGSTAGMLGANFHTTYDQMLAGGAEGMQLKYEEIFSDLAREFNLTIVAGSGYLPDMTGVLRHRSFVFGPDGRMLGFHDQTAAPQTESQIQLGDDLNVIDTPAGRLGILIEGEALYPEIARVMAFRGADLLVCLAAVDDEVRAAYIRQAALAHAQENQCYVVTSFLVGRNHLALDETARPLIGKSGIYAPLEMSARYSGVMVEMGTPDAEGVVTAEVDRQALRRLWETDGQGLRRLMPAALFARELPALYAAGHTLHEAEALPPQALLPAHAETAPGEAEETGEITLVEPPAPEDEIEPLPKDHEVVDEVAMGEGEEPEVPTGPAKRLADDDETTFDLEAPDLPDPAADESKPPDA